MTALRMRAFSKFDNIEVQVVLGTEEKINNAKNVLNNFCNQSEGCNRDMRLVDYINHGDNAETLVNRFVSQCQMTIEQAQNLLHRIIECCQSHYVYMYTNMFSTCQI